MSILSSDLAITVRVTHYRDRKEIIKILRHFTKKAIADISVDLKNDSDLFSIKLVKDKFYDGWKTFYSLVNALISVNATVRILVNGQLVDLIFVQQLKGMMASIKREDIY